MTRARWLAALAVLAGACDGEPPPPDACQASVVFLARNGGVYDRGPADDATQNLSVLVDVPTAMPRWPHAEGEWRELVTCIRDALAPFPIVVTEIDPDPQPHLEIVFTMTYWNGPAGTTMIVPASCRPGHQIEFVFGDALPTAIRACHMTMLGFAQMTALLSVGDQCEDYLNLGMDCSPSRAFLDRETPCVDAAGLPAVCRCGGTMQNGFAALSERFVACPRAPGS